MLFFLLQKHVAYPLYMLYQAIKFQVEKGPIDIITGHAHFSLNYEYLLDEDVTFAEVVISLFIYNNSKSFYYSCGTLLTW